MKRLHVLVASWDDVIEPFFREAIEGGGHHITIFKPWQKEAEFIAEAKSGWYDVIVLTNLRFPLDYSLGFIAPLRQACSAKVIVMSVPPDRRKGSPRNGGVSFYHLPMMPKQIQDAVEEAAGMLELSQ